MTTIIYKIFEQHEPNKKAGVNSDILGGKHSMCRYWHLSCSC